MNHVITCYKYSEKNNTIQTYRTLLLPDVYKRQGISIPAQKKKHNAAGIIFSQSSNK